MTLTLIGCSDNPAPSASSSPTSTESVAVAPKGNFKEAGTVAQLDKDRQLVFDKIRVVYDPTDKTKLLAVSTVCTHKQCDVKWKSDEKKYDCNCHGAEFAADGKVVEGLPRNRFLPMPLRLKMAKF